MIERSYFVQKFARLKFGNLSVLGYSVAGEETVTQIPELNVCFDFGRAPMFSLTSDIVCLSHGHMDHLAGIAYYLSQRYFQGMKAGTVLVPRELERQIDAMLQCWREVERQGTPYKLVPMSAGQMWEMRKDFGIRCFATHHGGTSLGYALVSLRDKLKPEFVGKDGLELAQLKRDGVQIQYRVEVPLVACLGDTTAGEVFNHPDVVNAEILITECTFFEPDHKAKAKAGRHLHVDQFVELFPDLRNQHIVLTHLSRRTSIRKARAILRKRLGDAAMDRVHFLMDFDHAVDAGDVDTTVPNVMQPSD